MCAHEGAEGHLPVRRWRQKHRKRKLDQCAHVLQPIPHRSEGAGVGAEEQRRLAEDADVEARRPSGHAELLDGVHHPHVVVRRDHAQRHIDGVVVHRQLSAGKVDDRAGLKDGDVVGLGQPPPHEASAHAGADDGCSRTLSRPHHRRSNDDVVEMLSQGSGEPISEHVRLQRLVTVHLHAVPVQCRFVGGLRPMVRQWDVHGDQCGTNPPRRRLVHDHITDGNYAARGQQPGAIAEEARLVTMVDAVDGHDLVEVALTEARLAQRGNVLDLPLDSAHPARENAFRSCHLCCIQADHARQLVLLAEEAQLLAAAATDAKQLLPLLHPRGLPDHLSQRSACTAIAGCMRRTVAAASAVLLEGPPIA
mmetsp:Transcript_44500/g.128641  ORF Transcript_44500/g.128641 Transcript_44500/m.128641 type:complete len:364 (+) Transcript_44500:959-2050(+)